jgi:hypothetical protein
MGAVGGIASSGCLGVAVGGADGTIGDGGGRSGCGIRSGLIDAIDDGKLVKRYD